MNPYNPHLHDGIILFNQLHSIASSVFDFENRTPYAIQVPIYWARRLAGLIGRIGYFYVDHAFRIIVWFRAIVDEKPRLEWTERVKEGENRSVHRVPLAVQINQDILAIIAACRFCSIESSNDTTKLN